MSSNDSFPARYDGKIGDKEFSVSCYTKDGKRFIAGKMDGKDFKMNINSNVFSADDIINLEGKLPKEVEQIFPFFITSGNTSSTSGSSGSHSTDSDFENYMIAKEKAKMMQDVFNQSVENVQSGKDPYLNALETKEKMKIINNIGNNNSGKQSTTGSDFENYIIAKEKAKMMQDMFNQSIENVQSGKDPYINYMEMKAKSKMINDFGK